jgi:hypothetical protein
VGCLIKVRNNVGQSVDPAMRLPTLEIFSDAAAERPVEAVSPRKAIVCKRLCLFLLNPTRGEQCGGISFKLRATIDA